MEDPNPPGVKPDVPEASVDFDKKSANDPLLASSCLTFTCRGFFKMDISLTFFNLKLVFGFPLSINSANGLCILLLSFSEYVWVYLGLSVMEFNLYFDSSLSLLNKSIKSPSFSSSMISIS